jgi:hypothetical protein
MRKMRISAAGTEHIKENTAHWPGLAMMCLVLIQLCLLAGTAASYVSDAANSQAAGIADYGMKIDVLQTQAEAVQNSACDYEKIISLDNRSQTALAYDIVVSLEGAENWPEGLTVVLLTGNGEKADGVVGGNICTFKDEDWYLEPGEHAQNIYGLRLATTYDTTPGDYRFSISSVTYQVHSAGSEG